MSEERYTVFYRYGDEANDCLLTRDDALSLANTLELDGHEVIVAECTDDEYRPIYDTMSNRNMNIKVLRLYLGAVFKEFPLVLRDENYVLTRNGLVKSSDKSTTVLEDLEHSVLDHIMMLVNKNYQEYVVYGRKDMTTLMSLCAAQIIKNNSSKAPGYLLRLSHLYDKDEATRWTTLVNSDMFKSLGFVENFDDEYVIVNIK